MESTENCEARLSFVSAVRVPTSVGNFRQTKDPTKVGTLTPVLIAEGLLRRRRRQQVNRERSQPVFALIIAARDEWQSSLRVRRC